MYSTISYQLTNSRSAVHYLFIQKMFWDEENEKEEIIEREKSLIGLYELIELLKVGPINKFIRININLNKSLIFSIISW